MESILLEKTGQVARITLNRPDKLNCFDGAMALALQEVLDQCQDDANVRAVYLTGAGRAFCAGQDLQALLGADAPSFDTILGDYFNPIIERIRALEAPVVGAVNGVAAGAGANLALACDIAVAAESAGFIQAFSKIGLVPDSGGTFHLPRLIGMQKAAALMMLGEKVGAPEAAAMGMIYRTFPDGEFADASFQLAERLSQLPTRALAMTKRLLNDGVKNDLHQQLQLEEKLQVEAGQTNDFREGVDAFLEKRKPEFKGH